MTSQRLRSLIAGSALVLAVVVSSSQAQTPVLEKKQTIALKGKGGNFDHLAIDSKRDRLLVANKANNTLDIVDLKSGKLLKQVRDQGGIQGIAYAPDLDRVFVGLGTGGFCNTFDGNDYKLLKTIKFMDDSDNVRYDPRTHIVYVAHAEKALGVIDAKTNEQKPDITLPGAAEGFQIETGRPILYVNIPAPPEVAVIDTDKNTVVKHYKVGMAGGHHPLALDEANHRLFLGCRKKPMVVVMDSETGKEITGVEIPGDIDDLFYDAKNKRLYASCGDGAIAVIRQNSADKYELQEKIETAKNARTSYYDAATGRYFLAVPRQTEKGAPEIWVYQVRQ
jgi:DNA-binding beta-propeller fold protein YncE